jgi:hypothetical protein
MVTLRLPNVSCERLLLALLGVAGTAGCYDVNIVDPGIEVLPDASGQVELGKNPLGIQGWWFAYGDRYDTQSCVRIGMHGDMCSQVYFPPPLAEPVTCDGSDITYQTFPLDFPNQKGVMCSEGQIGEVMNCDPNVVLNCNEGVDYSNMWGAGIGLDFDLDVSSGTRDPSKRQSWDARAHGIAGVAFDLQLIDDGDLGNPYMRVEFPIVLPDGLPLTPGKGAVGLNPCAEPVQPGAGAVYPDKPTPSEEHPQGSPFWGAPATFAEKTASPVRVGHNEVRFSDVHAAPSQDEYEFDATKLLGIQFHVPSYKADNPALGGHFGYGFCISNLTFLRQ